MSWSIDITGLRAAVKANVLDRAKQPYLPDGIRQVIAEVCDDNSIAPTVNNGIRVVSHGHIGGCGNVSKLEINPVQILTEIPVPIPATEPASGAEPSTA